MDVDGIELFLRELGADIETMRVKKNWVTIRCPLAEWTHEFGDKNPSFGISISPESSSVYYCFGCTEVAQPLGRLIQSIWLLSGSYPMDAAKVLVSHEIFDGEEAREHIPDFWNELKPVISSLPLDVLKKHPLLSRSSGYEARRCADFLEVSRKVSPLIWNMCGVRLSESQQAVVFPLTNIRGDIYIMRLRSRKQKRMWTLSAERAGYDYDFPSTYDVGVWFGMHLVDWTRPVILVEGELDAMRLMSLGCFNVVAAAGSSITKEQVTALCTDTLVIGLDADKGGEKGKERIKRIVGKTKTLLSVDWGIVGCNDPGELETEEQVSEVFDHISLL